MTHVLNFWPDGQDQDSSVVEIDNKEKEEDTTDKKGKEKEKEKEEDTTDEGYADSELTNRNLSTGITDEIKEYLDLSFKNVLFWEKIYRPGLNPFGLFVDYGTPLLARTRETGQDEFIRMWSQFGPRPTIKTDLAPLEAWRQLLEMRYKEGLRLAMRNLEYAAKAETRC